MSWNLVTEVESLWPEVEPLLSRAVDTGYGEFDIKQLHRLLRSMKMRLLVYHGEDSSVDLACVFELVHYPAKTVFRVVLLGGRAAGTDAFKEWERVIEPFAREIGASEIEAWCGPAQVRHFRKWGLEPRYTIVTKELRHAH